MLRGDVEEYRSEPPPSVIEPRGGVAGGRFPGLGATTGGTFLLPHVPQGLEDCSKLET